MHRYIRQIRSFLLPAVVVFAAVAVARPAAASFELYKKTLRSTAFVIVNTAEGKRYINGTCWVVDAQRRLLVSNWHVIDEAQSVEVHFAHFRSGEPIQDPSYYLTHGRPIAARVLAADRSRDLSLIQAENLPEGTAALPLNLAGPGQGEVLMTVGFRGDRNLHRVWVYRVSEVQRTGVRGIRVGGIGEIRAPMIRTSPRFHHGNSGGPVVDARGRLVGVVCCSHPVHNNGHSISAAAVLQFVRANLPSPLRGAPHEILVNGRLQLGPGSVTDAAVPANRFSAETSVRRKQASSQPCI